MEQKQVCGLAIAMMFNINYHLGLLLNPCDNFGAQEYSSNTPFLKWKE